MLSEGAEAPAVRLPAYVDAERLFDAASDLSEPPDPAAFELTDDGVELGESVVVHPADDDGYDWRADDPDAVDTDLGLDDAALDDAVAGQSEYDDASDQPDTVEGDLEMDLDAVEELDEDESAVDGDTDGPDPDGPGAEGGEADADAAPIYRGGSAEGTDQSAAPGHEAVPDGPDDLGGSDDGEADGQSDDGEAIEEIDLVDPTDGDDEEESSDERADWDIPGR